MRDVSWVGYRDIVTWNGRYDGRCGMVGVSLIEERVGKIEVGEI